MKLFFTVSSSASGRRGARLARAFAAGLLCLLTSAAYAQLSVINLSPARNARSAPRTTDVSATFSQPLSNNASTLGALKVFSAQAGGLKAGTASVSSNTLNFNPNADFKAGETVFATVTSAAQSSGGAPVAPHVFQFTTATAPAPGLFSGGSNISLTNPDALVTGDIDADGDLDLIIRPFESSTLAVRLNDGKGTFSNGINVPVGFSIHTLKLGDVDNDGDLDLFTITATKGVSIHRNDGTGNFNTVPEVLVGVAGKYPIGQALGDLDADGDLDLLIASQSDFVSVCLNDGNGTFAITQDVATLTGADGITLGDLDGDGDLDLVTSPDGFGFPAVSVRFNDGQGRFSGTLNVPSKGLPYNVVLGDVDGDGDLDLVIANERSSRDGGYVDNSVSIRLNNGSGAFNESKEVPLEAIITEVQLSDIDGDSDLDMAIANSFSTTLVRVNDGNGNFSGTQVLPIASTRAVAFGDVDGDNDLDLLIASSGTGSAVNVRLNQAPPSPVLTNVSPNTAPVGGRVVITGNNFLTTSSITFNGIAADSFQIVLNTQLIAFVPVGATSGPLVVTSTSGPSNELPFTVGPTPTVVSTSPKANALAVPRTSPIELTFDRELVSTPATLTSLRVSGNQSRGFDLATVSGNKLSSNRSGTYKPGETVFVTLSANPTSNSSQVFWKPYVFQFTAATAPATGMFSGGSDPAVLGNPQSVAIGDLDRDGDLDLAVVDNPASSSLMGSASVRINNGAGVFTTVGYVSVGRGPYQIVLADTNFDGLQDIFTANSSHDPGATGTVSVRRSLGFGNYYVADQEVPVGTNPHGLALGDLNGDGELDIVAANYTAGTSTATSTVSVRLKGRPYFATTGQEVVVGSRPLNVVLGDLDSDGDLDLVTSSSNGTTASVRFNDGLGTFSGNLEVSVGFNPHQVVLGDVDGDGDLDLLTANYYDYTNPRNDYTSSVVAVRLNDGKGAFSGTQQVSVGQGANSLALGDADGDGDLDLFATNELTNSISVRLNNGAGIFSGTQQVAVGNTPTSIALGDLDGDGTLDLATANYGGSTASVRLNQALGSAKVLANAPARLVEQVELYPNPAHTSAWLQLPTVLSKQGVQVNVLNALGQTVLSRQFGASEAANTPELPLGTLAAGLYTVQLRTGEGLITKRLAVK
ncbi:FG-GAP-like repeat-containing protein [Hymenobacter sp. GOD-10R]|uniref:FG-GAP-like repeat-containing protein n=1 Tax=Hymenobacter sp. GOD-10R TaxID=3093922 RepID=UPI002D7A19F9|nr:FG-GAP-like repeat-containing protein [Hymenobacter sp. GOD-10R]WRQ28443.1 FG-GAP-like repeat-containing protein [Hymenobacter sp. GOD-10R]